MTKLNLELPKDSQVQALISIMQTIREMDIRSTGDVKIKQPAKTTENDFLYSKDRLDFQIEMIKSLAG